VNAIPHSRTARFPFRHDPSSWYCLGLAADLPIGGLETRHFVGRAVILFRGEDGLPGLIDAYCPHLGAHMGKGGKVCGAAVRCPFHHFDFDAAGACVKTSYGQPPPRAAAARAWPVIERNGLLFAWHDADGAPPSFELPTLATEGFAGPYLHTWTLRTHPQEISENSVDVGHFGVVHKYTEVSENAPLRLEGPRLFVAYSFRRAVEALGLKLGTIRTDFTGEMHGIGYSHVSSLVQQVGIRSLHLVLPTPAAEGQTELRIVLWTAAEGKLIGPAAPLRLLPAALANRLIGVFAFLGYKNDVAQDIEIWENKVYVHPPALARGDGPIGRYRAWCQQFYARLSGATEAPRLEQRERSGAT
jgi:nitrite reductase/ring-hydroxylating ferredoxin subunit